MAERPSEESRSGDAGSGSISDEEWAKFLRDSESGIPGSAPKEPSARARMVTERLRREEAQGGVPEGWRTGPAWREMDGRAARRRRLWAILGVPVAIALAVVAVRPSLIPGDPFHTTREPVAASPLPVETAAPTAAPESVDPDVPTLDRPFAGSPAAAWSDGVKGIVLPEAKAVGSFSKAQVAQALRQTRTLLVDANLDAATLRGKRPTAALGVIEPQQTELIDLLNTSLRKPDRKHDPLLMFSRFDPDEVRLVGDVVKDRGRVTFKAGEHGSVAVHADYTFVYPLTRADNSSTEVARTIVRRVLDLELSDPAKYRVTPGKVSVTFYTEEFGNSACDVYDGYLHPEFRTAGVPAGASPTGPTIDPYDRSRDLEKERTGECGTASRT
ncbi:hypothetical protein ACFV0T_09900 [Streptomyces sp. NPDC059582]|uniref:hypothetical protein n=1 Tax=Streptomyces sp. NPDC059582 TaxID=3346875 RepID=UPI0036CB3FF9